MFRTFYLFPFRCVESWCKLGAPEFCAIFAFLSFFYSPNIDHNALLRLAQFGNDSRRCFETTGFPPSCHRTQNNLELTSS